MSLAWGHRTGNVTELRQQDFGMQSLRQHIYLLEKSLDRYEYLRESGAPDIILWAEKALVARQLLFLFNLSKEVIK
jgi:hypothetical protein